VSSKYSMVDLKKKLLELYKKHYSYYSSYSSSHIHKVDSIKYVIGDKSLSDKIFNFLMLLFVFLKKLLDIVMVIYTRRIRLCNNFVIYDYYF